MDAFDADVLIYAAAPRDPRGRRVRSLLPARSDTVSGGRPVGSVLLLPEVLAKPQRGGDHREHRRLLRLLGRIELLPVDRGVAQLATELGAELGLKAVDAVHLATATIAGADRFITDNGKDFGSIDSPVPIVFPMDLADPST